MTLTLDVRTPDGGTAGTVELDEAIFGIEPNMAALHQVVTAQLAARRRGTHSTRTRAEVRGGGAKPWRQKGTGRARAGSIDLAQVVTLLQDLLTYLRPIYRAAQRSLLKYCPFNYRCACLPLEVRQQC